MRSLGAALCLLLAAASAVAGEYPPCDSPTAAGAPVCDNTASPARRLTLLPRAVRIDDQPPESSRHLLVTGVVMIVAGGLLLAGGITGLAYALPPLGEFGPAPDCSKDTTGLCSLGATLSALGEVLIGGLAVVSTVATVGGALLVGSGAGDLVVRHRRFSLVPTVSRVGGGVAATVTF